MIRLVSPPKGGNWAKMHLRVPSGSTISWLNPSAIHPPSKTNASNSQFLILIKQSHSHTAQNLKAPGAVCSQSLSHSCKLSNLPP